MFCSFPGRVALYGRVLSRGSEPAAPPGAAEADLALAARPWTITSSNPATRKPPEVGGILINGVLVGVQVSASGSGLGRQLSLQLARQGCKVICVDQDAAQVQETLGLLQAQQVPCVQQMAQTAQAAAAAAASPPAWGPDGAARGFACDWRNPGEALGLSRAVTSAEGGVDLIFVVPESNNNNESAVDGAGKVVGNEFWPLLGFLPGMLARARGHVVHVLDEQIADKTGAVADAWIESLREVGADVRYTKVHLHADQARHRPCRAEDAARFILSAVRQGSSEVHIAYPLC
ncbi:hypothetical protein ONE63_000571 [Megalurothrips usitatus]|uniref:Uncharacterized protein n=1 Tax=Megalurothrips usitatus TaxID=439358 RepID=A0AAV7Y4X1_9NEOP|nr:hypothetical protein ONE63_000571 [Megalurothrips usitatus]